MAKLAYGLSQSLDGYVDHTKLGRETPRRDVELIEQRLREAEKIAKGRKP